MALREELGTTVVAGSNVGIGSGGAKSVMNKMRDRIIAYWQRQVLSAQLLISLPTLSCGWQSKDQREGYSASKMRRAIDKQYTD